MQASVSAAPAGSGPSPPASSNRLLYLDWLRTIAVYLVAVVHTAVSVARVSSYRTDDLQLQNTAIRGLVQIGMPFFFFLSGSATCLLKPASFAAFLQNKTLRLVIPCLIAMPVVVLPTAYIGRRYRPCAARDIDDFAEFAYDFFSNQFACGGFEWLWFLPASFALAIVNFPLFAAARAAYRDADALRLTLPSLLFDASWTLIAMLAAISASLQFELSLAEACLALAPFFVVLPVIRCLALFRRLPIAFGFVSVCNVLPSLIVAYHRPRYRVPDVVVGFVFYNLFYVEGFLRQLLSAESAWVGRSSLAHRLTMPARMLLVILLASICFPSADDGVGYMFAYPLYPTDGVRCCLFVIGTWNLIALISACGRAFYNQEFHAGLFRHGTRSSVIVYVFHWLYIDLVQVVVVIPLRLTPLPALCLVFPLAIALCWLTYALIMHVPGLCYGFGLSSLAAVRHRSAASAQTATPIGTTSRSGYGMGPSRILLDITYMLSPRSNQKSEPISAPGSSSLRPAAI